MKSRLLLVLALMLPVTSLVLLGQTSASAAGYSARLARTPIVGEAARITGAVRPAGRPIGLQRLVDGTWVQVSTKRTGTAGRYAFDVRAHATPYTYRSYAPRVTVRGRTYGLTYSNNVRVAPVQARLSLAVMGAPVGQSRTGTGNLSPAQAVFRPARAGTAVGLQKLVNGSWSRVGVARQDASGVARFQVAAGTPAASGSYRAYSTPAGTATTFSGPVSPSRMTKVWGDEFSGRSLDTSKWRYRLAAAGGNRKCSTPASAAQRLTTVGNGVAQLRVRKVGRATRTCRYGTFKNSVIEASGSKGFTGRYGVYAARMRFQSAKGMHGAFWMQGPAVTGDEIDVAEYYGAGRPDGGFSTLVHHSDSRGRVSSYGGVRSIAKILGPGRSPSSVYHVYSVEWTPTRYVFRVDGSVTFATNRPHVSSSPESMILSLLTSDWELPALRTTKTAVSVDWVRVWQNSTS